ncbi:hypothetical protein D7Y13_42560, partial [Corallococcus praedator]
MNGNDTQTNEDPILDLTTNSIFNGANIAVKVIRKEREGGNGLVDGFTINAHDDGGPSYDLGKISVKGNLTGVDAGDDDLETPAIKSITATTWGPIAASDDDAIPSEILGNIGTITVTRFNGYIQSVEDYTGPGGT